MGSRYARRGHALWRTAPGFLVVSSIDGRTVQAGGSAAAIWRLLPEHDQPPRAVDELIGVLAADHGVDVDVVAADTRTVLAELEAIGCAVLDV